MMGRRGGRREAEPARRTRACASAARGGKGQFKGSQRGSLLITIYYLTEIYLELVRRSVPSLPSSPLPIPLLPPATVKG